MKTNELRQFLRQLIKEEVAAEVNKAMGKVLVEMVKEIKKPSKAELVENVEIDETFDEVIPPINTKNTKLNTALAQTAKNFKPLPKQPVSSMVELMEGGFDKIGKHEKVAVGTPATKLDFLKQMVNESVQPQAASVLDNNAELPEPIKNIFKKDFRSILALSKTKNGGYSPNVSMS